jgi:TolB protein
VLFVSDRGGSPQIYKRRSPAAHRTDELRRQLQYDAARCARRQRASHSSKRDNSRFNIAVQDIASRQVQVLTQGGNDESPTFAPNGRMILYASGQGGRGILAAVSSDGRVKQRLSSAGGGDVREPAWGPLGN